MKRLLSLILAIAMMCCMLPFNAFNLTASAVENTEKITEYTSGCFTYTYDALKGEATIVRCDTSVSGEVTIPSTLEGYPITEIYSYAFSCDSLKDVYYYGTEEEWNNITIASGNDSLINANIYYMICSCGGEFGPWITTEESTCISEGTQFHLCNSCGAKEESVIRTTEHIYDNSCDTQCNFCGNIRTISHNYSLRTITPPTCYENGYTTYECSVCGYSYIDDYTDATGHTEFEWVVDYDATCEYEGLKSKFCVECEEYIESEMIPVKGHTESDWIIYNYATCEEEGCKVKECTVCGVFLFSETISAAGHTEVKDSAVAPTCTETGLTEGKHCLVCNAVIVAQNVVSATGHSYGSWVVNSEPTCTGTGSKSRSCSICGNVETATIPAKGHSYSSEWTIDVAPTCTATGSKSHHCTVCDAKTDVTIIEATGHTESDWMIDAQATCIIPGSKHIECTNCSFIIEIVPILATGHNIVTDSAKEATCTETGLTEGKHCSVCNAVIVAQNVVPAKGHTTTEWIVDADSTCTEKGTKNKECTVCNATVETAEIPVKGHTTVIDAAVAPSCTTTGKTEGSHCSVCNVVIVAQSVVPAKGHTKSDWKTDKKATVNAAGKKVKKCTVCGETVETGKIAQLKCSKPSLKKIKTTADGVKITWGKVSGADSYAVYRKTGSGAYKKIATVKGNSKVTYTDKKASSGKKGYYYVKAVNEVGESRASNSKSILYLADTTLSTPKSTKNGITLKWKKVTGADGYQVWRKTGSGSYKNIATVKGNSKVTYTDKSAKKGKTYTYKIKAYKSKTTSAYSNAKKIKDKY